MKGYWNIGGRSAVTLKLPTDLKLAKREVEALTPLKLGWTAEWETHKTSKVQGKSVKPFTFRLYLVRNSNGRVVNVVYLAAGAWNFLPAKKRVSK